MNRTNTGDEESVYALTIDGKTLTSSPNISDIHAFIRSWVDSEETKSNYRTSPYFRYTLIPEENAIEVDFGSHTSFLRITKSNGDIDFSDMEFESTDRPSNPVKRLIFLDFDGVCTNYAEGSYLTNDDSTYGFSETCVSRLEGLCMRTGAKIIISSNWRKFDSSGCWMSNGKRYSNPLPRLRKRLGDLIAGELPKDRHITKSQALELFFEDCDERPDSYVILDDDPSEGYGAHPEFSRHYIQTVSENGLTDEDVERAVLMLKHPTD